MDPAAINQVVREMFSLDLFTAVQKQGHAFFIIIILKNIQLE